MLGTTSLVAWLRETDPAALEKLWQEADAVRCAHVGDAVHLRGLIEFSNHCVRQCTYCGIRRDNTTLGRYRMSADEILACAQQAVELGYGTVVLQSGEDYGATAAWVADVVRRIKAETPLAVTLSLGERRDKELLRWRQAGADRYLLRFETSNDVLYERIHPSLPGRRSDRIGMLRRLRELGYEVGSGVMVGIPGQSWDDLAQDISGFGSLDLDMIGVGPYIPHPMTPLAGAPTTLAADRQVPNDELTTLKAVALARLVCPDANIPSTTALATIDRVRGRELGLSRGANIVMPNLTPPEYRRRYEIYPGKACIEETATVCHQCVSGRIESIGRTVGRGRGDSRARQLRGTTSRDREPD
jgi:biotin synthase